MAKNKRKGPGHPNYIVVGKKNPICRTCFAIVPKRAAQLTGHIDWHASEGHKVRVDASIMPLATVTVRAL